MGTTVAASIKISTAEDRSFALIEAAAVKGARCPANLANGGTIPGAHISQLVKDGRIRVEIYALNYRVITILKGPHAGKSTRGAPRDQKPYLVNGVHVHRISDARRKIAP